MELSDSRFSMAIAGSRPVFSDAVTVTLMPWRASEAAISAPAMEPV